jgi:hypothetical protein
MTKFVGRHVKSKPTADEALERIAQVRDEVSKTELINSFIENYDQRLQERLPAVELAKYLEGLLSPDEYRNAMGRFELARRELGPAASVEAVALRAGEIRLVVKRKADIALKSA